MTANVATQAGLSTLGSSAGIMSRQRWLKDTGSVPDRRNVIPTCPLLRDRVCRSKSKLQVAYVLLFKELPIFGRSGSGRPRVYDMLVRQSCRNLSARFTMSICEFTSLAARTREVLNRSVQNFMTKYFTALC
jgi:hypothetical protein